MEQMSMKVIAHIRSDFPTKFGIPRQSGLVEELRATVVLEPEFRNPQALRGLEGFSHLWLIWEFSQARREGWSPTVRPPRLGGNRRMGVFATRSPFRPNPIGLSCVLLEGVVQDPKLGPVIWVRGADLMDGTPILDIKPYLPYVDCQPQATGGFVPNPREPALQVSLPSPWRELVPPHHLAALEGVLAQDPRPQYQQDPQRVYALEFAGLEVRFQVEGRLLTVLEIRPLSQKNPT